MKSISSEELFELEQYCDWACEVLKNGTNDFNSDIIKELKKRIRLKKNYKVEKNFAYIYYDISNFDKILNGQITILKEIEEVHVNYGNQSLKYVKIYKLLVNGKEFVNLKLNQNLEIVCLSSEARNYRFIIPVFICNSVDISINQYGFTKLLLVKTYDIEKINYLNSRLLNSIFKLINLKIINTDEKIYKLEIYNDDNLVLEEKYAISQKVKRFLTEQLSLGNITENELVFNKKITTYKEENIKDFRIRVEFEEDDNLKSYFNLSSNPQMTICELTNSSKIKIVVTEIKNSLEDKVVTLEYFLKKYLLTNYGNLELKVFDNRNFFKVDKKWITNSGKKLSYYNENEIRFKEMYDLKFDIKKENEIFLPTQVTLYNKNVTKNTLLSEFIDIDNGKVYLTQYLYIKVLEEDVKQKFILRVVYHMKQASFSFGKTQIKNVIIPTILKDKCCLIMLDKDKNFDLSKVNKNQIQKIFSLYVVTSREYVVSKIFKEILNQKKYEVGMKFDLEDLFEKDKEIDFSKTKKVSFDKLITMAEYNESYDENLTEKQIETLIRYYDEK